MTDRTTADITADLRRMDGSPTVGALRREAADRLAELDALVAQATRVIKDRDEWNDSLVADAADLQEHIDALRPPCPTCGGVQSSPSDLVGNCPDCVDGKVSIEQLVTTYNAVHGGINIDPALVANDHEAGYVAAFADLRGVKP